jgi:hypothetical protein
VHYHQGFRKGILQWRPYDFPILSQAYDKRFHFCHIEKVKELLPESMQKEQINQKMQPILVY